MRTVRIERELVASPAALWHALTDPAALTAWFWPPQIEPAIDADARVGGTLRLSATGVGATAVYTAVDPPRRFVLRWRWDGDDEGADDDDESTVTVELSPMDPTGVRLTLTHEAIDEAFDGHLAGWSSCLDRLPGYLDHADR